MNLINQEVYNELPEILSIPLSNFEGRERDIIFISMLGALSSILPNVYGEYDSDTVYPNLYFFIVAPPASGKGRIKLSKTIISELFKDKQNQYKSDLSKYIKELEKYEILKKEGVNDIDKPIKPIFRPLLIPANSSVARFEEFLDEQGVESSIIFETEADSLTNIFNTEFGDYSSDLRSAFHSESISKSRKGNEEFRYIECPKLSVIISGTPDQVQKLMDTKENGLFSRFNYYYFNEISDWHSVKPDPKKRDIKNSFLDFSKHTTKLFNRLKNREFSIEFELTDNQWTILDDTFREIHDESNIDTAILSNVKRLGLNTFRFAMILSVLRNYDKFSCVPTGYSFASERLICQDKDFEISIKIALSLLPNTEEILQLYTRNSNFISSTEKAFINKFEGREFTTGEAIEFAISCKIGKRTYDDYRKRWLNKGLIEMIRTGVYRFK